MMYLAANQDGLFHFSRREHVSFAELKEHGKCANFICRLHNVNPSCHSSSKSVGTGFLLAVAAQQRK
jgi:hypothetical protein